MDYRNYHKEHVIEGNLTLNSHPVFSFRENFFCALKPQLSKRRPDIIIASCDSHIGYVAARIAENLSIPFAFDLYHNYEDFGSNRIPGMKWMYHQALYRAALVVCDSEPLMRLVANRCKRLFVAQQATDKSVFYPMNKEQCRKDLGLSTSETLLAYIGSVNQRFDRDTVLEALDGLSKAGINARLVIAGAQIDTITEKHPMTEYLGKLNQKDVPKVIASADVCLIPYKSTALANTCNPCKLSEYIACERPIIASAVSNIHEYLPRSKNLCYTPGNAEELLKSILNQIRNPVLEDPDSALTWNTIGDKYLFELERLQTTPYERKKTQVI